MEKPQTILVTGCGGDIGQSVGKIIKMNYKDIKVIGCDIYDKHAGHLIFDICEVVPKATSPNYMKELKEVINKYKPDFIFPISEAELNYFYKNKITKIANVGLIRPNFKAMKIANDKFLTQEFLKENDLPYAWTIKASDGKPKEFPCILKDIFGRGSKNLKIIYEEDYETYKDYSEEFIFQEYLLPDDEEYTCGVFRTKKSEVRTIIFNRTLSRGYTNYGEVVVNEEISKLLKVVAEKLNLIGSINVQLRLTKKGPVIFEINARYSSTVLFRHMLGFEDVIWSVDDYFNNPLEKQEPAKAGTKIYKGWQEYIVYKDNSKATIDNTDFKMRLY
ncbi:ATP-grasp domain-containing protein [Natroniella sp. ANB-PHB2]|uniref:ATP-grasp domain-containing protein n=1 Tax=Natroniella sp. ANB-PHB2 TaxID=3384444 RepID=UPI0038D400CD